LLLNNLHFGPRQMCAAAKAKAENTERGRQGGMGRWDGCGTDKVTNMLNK